MEENVYKSWIQIINYYVVKNFWRNIVSTVIINGNNINIIPKNLKLFLCFILSIIIYLLVFINTDSSYYASIGALFGFLMAINIGANDVANNLSASIGAGAMSIKTGLVIAIIFEFAGAMVAGGEVTSTIKKGIIDSGAITSTSDFIWIMNSALAGAAIWLSVATRFGYPVSTTHSIVGGIMGAGIMYGIVGEGTLANGLSIVNWFTMLKIAASWILSPVIGGLIAYGIFSVIRNTIIYTDDKILAAKKYVPILISAMSFVFSTYLVLKGLKKIWGDVTTFGKSLFDFIEISDKPSLLSALVVALIISIIIYIVVKPLIEIKANKIGKDITDDNIKTYKVAFLAETKKEATESDIHKYVTNRGLTEDDLELAIYKLFIIPVIVSAGALCFAHGSNDVANAIGPLAAIIDAVQSGDVHSKALIPLWIMLLGAGGLALGLALFGGKMVQKIGSEVVELSIIAAFAVNFSAALTVVLASQLGIPVSSTHIAIGAFVGVGVYREMKSNLNQKIKKFEVKLKNSQNLVIEFQEKKEKHITKKEKIEKEHSDLDVLYNKYKQNIEEKKEVDSKYSKTIDEEADLKRFNRQLKHFQDDIVDLLEKISKLDSKIVKETKSCDRRKLALAGVEKESFIERGFAKKIAITWVVTIPCAMTISALVYVLQRGFFI